MRVFGIVGWKNSGKTTLMERLVSEFVGRGLTVSTVKHAHHGVDVDQPGRDSFRHRAAGAHEVMLVSANRWALMRELRGEAEPSLETLLSRLAPVDLVLVEGFKRADHPKIEVARGLAGRKLLAEDDPTILAIASDAPSTALGRPHFHLDEVAVIADFIAAAPVGIDARRTGT